MRTALLASLLFVSCGEATDDLVSIGDVLIVVDRTAGPDVSCVLQTPTSCGCAMSECTKEALIEATRQCNVLRGYTRTIVVE